MCGCFGIRESSRSVEVRVLEWSFGILKVVQIVFRSDPFLPSHLHSAVALIRPSCFVVCHLASVLCSVLAVWDFHDIEFVSDFFSSSGKLAPEPRVISQTDGVGS